MTPFESSNIPQNFALSSDQYRSATMFGNIAGRAMPGIVFVGHSLGGGLATAALGNSSRAGGAYTFNAAGLNPGTLARYGGNYAHVTANTQHWYYTSDPLTSAQARLGSRLLAGAAGNWNAIIDREGNGSLLHNHSINTLVSGIEAELSKLGCK